jgi:hypothetical protein
MRRTVIALTGTLATLAFAAAPAQALTATTQSPANVTETSATMRGKVDPGLLSVAPSFYFEYGRTQAYGSKTPVSSFGVPTIVRVTLVSVPSSTTIHYRIVASGLLSTARGADMSFRTLDPPPPPPPPTGDNSGDGSSGSGSSGSDSGSSGSDSSGSSGTGSDPSGSGSDSSGSGSSGSDSSGSGSSDSGSAGSGSSGSGSSDSGDQGTGDPSSSGDQSGSGDLSSGSGNGSASEQLAVTVKADDPAKPVLGSTIGAAPETGSVQVRTPGAGDFTELQDGAPIPVGSTIDARGGTVNVVTAVGNAGKVQTATFRGAVFQVKQSRKAGGVTDIYLRGGDFSSCKAPSRTPAGVRLLAKKNKKHAIRKLWGHDHHGRFRTHGRGAIATVRGTTWVVADHCDGTRTSVISGAVSVRDKRRHKTVLVHAGHSYFARTHS